MADHVAAKEAREHLLHNRPVARGARLWREDLFDRLALDPSTQLLKLGFSMTCIDRLPLNRVLKDLSSQSLHLSSRLSHDIEVVTAGEYVVTRGD